MGQVAEETKPPDQPSSLVEAAQIEDRTQRPLNQLARNIAGQAPLNIPVETESAGAIKPREIQPTEEGSGAFGRWMLDDHGLPAYRYDMNQRRDARAYFPNSEGLDRRDHWHQIGNDHVTGMASNDGTIQVFLADRGGVFLNWWDPRQNDFIWSARGLVTVLFRLAARLYGQIQFSAGFNSGRNHITPRGSTKRTTVTNPPGQVEQDADLHAHTGGFSYLKDEKETWATAFRYAPNSAKFERVFGIGYYKSVMEYRGIRVTRRVYAPHGDEPFFIAEVDIENLRDTEAIFSHYEYWDVNVHQLQIQWTRTGVIGQAGDMLRGLINNRFFYSLGWLPTEQALRFEQTRDNGPRRAEEERHEADTRPPGVFLANLSSIPATFFVRKSTFFGKGGPIQPDAVVNGDAGLTAIPDEAYEHPMPFCMVLRHDFKMARGAPPIKLRFAYGAVEPGQSLDFLNPYRTEDTTLQTTVDTWKEKLAYFSTGHDLALSREMTWHAYSLLSATLYSENHRTHYTPQGSAYLYLHGADGVPRDQALFSLALSYIRPDLARDNLVLLMRLQRGDNFQLPYSFVGDGATSFALGFHAFPSDLDLFLLLAASEYLAATGDLAFLKTELPFFPPAGHTPLTVLDHLTAAFTHLRDGIGVGSHGLLRIGDGDWDDAVVFTTTLNPTVGADRDETIREGESVPNTQMALYVLPLAANILESHAPALAADMRKFEAELRTALTRKDEHGQYILWADTYDKTTWLERLLRRLGLRKRKPKPWFTRAYLRDLPQWNLKEPPKAGRANLLGDHTFSLQSQVWALISGLAGSLGVEKQLVDAIDEQLDNPSPTGAMLEPGGQVWPAVSQLLTWGYCRHFPKLAWRSLNRHTFATHAVSFPNVWFNIWTGPDGTNSLKSSNPGGTWASEVTPMTDFPAMNANQHAMALLGLLRVCGVEPAPEGDGLMIYPKFGPDCCERFSLDTQLLLLDVAPGRIVGAYRPIVAGSRVLHVYLPSTAHDVELRLDGQPSEVNLGTSDDGGRVVKLSLVYEAIREMKFEVRWK